MPIPQKQKGEKKSEFMNRCMGDSVMNREFPDQKQRAAVCNSKWEEKKKTAKASASFGGEEFLVE